MRAVVCALVVSLGACASDGEPIDYCQAHPNDIGCGPAPQFVNMTTQWSFETLDGSIKAPCLPGEPPVTLHFTSAYLNTRAFDSPCATGAATVTLDGTYFIRWITSQADHEYQSLSAVNAQMPVLLVVYTDAGHIGPYWNVRCEQQFITTIRLYVDDVAMQDVRCLEGGATVGPLPEGPHTIRGEALDVAENKILIANVIDVEVTAGTIVSAPLQFTPP